ncbi:SHOCT domain-containing protein [Lactiplantibacillus plantarum]
MDKILVENENNEPTTLSTPTNSSDELRKLKSLLDDGILTEEEFAAKKKQILGI